MRVVHEDQRHAAVVLHVPGADVLAVTAEIRVGEGLLVERPNEAGGAAAELHVGPPRFAHRREVEPVARLDKLALGGGQRVVGVTLYAQPLSLLAAPEPLLCGAYRVCEHDVGVSMGHGGLLWRKFCPPDQSE